MAKTFFVDWPLWQQMTFVLAAAIVLTIAAGYVKVAYTYRKMKKFNTPAPGARAQQEPQMVESGMRGKKEEEIPFGIKAIQSGIEVEGVWISGANTPANRSPTNSVFEKQQPEPPVVNIRSASYEIPHSAGPSSVASSSRPSAFDRAVSAERLPNDYPRDTSPPDSIGAGKARQHRPPPTAYSRYSATVLKNEGDTYDTRSTASERGDIDQPRASTATFDHYRHQQSYTDDSYLSTSPETIRTSPNSKDPRADLRLLQSHRMSHVAETGSLARRERRKTSQSGYSNYSIDVSHIRYPSSSGPPSLPSVDSEPLPPLPAGYDAANPFMSPSEINLASPTRDSHPENATVQGQPLLESYQPRRPNLDYDEEYMDSDAHDAQQSTQVLRKVNSGFEILKPGTFPQVPQNDAAQQPKKLQKKQRQGSTSSRTSNFIEQV
ncbi:uncharacterized protein J3D65DRAFT_697954 [Phyllosticta citribraziliensis]|uniref:Uncharacterized protein n=1 Tax=Phyllosticta citribraziliensis TaxID=989973 RepID=A0ABR1LNC2_9PEZI